MVVHSWLERKAPEAGPCWFNSTLEEELGRFIQDMHIVFVVEDFSAVITEGTNAYQVVLESHYDMSASYWQGGKLEVTGGCGGIACVSRGSNVDGRCRLVGASTGSGGGEVYTTGTTV